MLTAKGKYGIKALLHLAALRDDARAASADIAAQNNLSKKFLDSILRELRQAGLVQSRKGPGGGYALARPPVEIMVGQAVRALDGPLAPIACASRSAFKPCADCRDLEGCAVRVAMSRVRDAMSGVLDTLTLVDLMTFGHPSGTVLDFQI